MDVPLVAADGDSLATMLSKLTTGGDSAQFTILLQLCSDRVKACPANCWAPVSTGSSRVSARPTSPMHESVPDTHDGEEPEAEGVDVSAVLGGLGLSPQCRTVGEDDSSDSEAAPMQGVIPMTDVEISRRKAVWHWFSDLSQDEKERVLTITDKAWTGFLLKLADQVRRKGDGVFIIDTLDAFSGNVDAALAGIAANSTRPRRSSFSGKPLKAGAGSSERSQPEVLFRSWRAIGKGVALGRRSAWAKACTKLQDSIRLADSRGRYDTLTVARELLVSPQALFEVLDEASLHWFLCNPTPMPSTPASESWVQTDWLSSFNVFTIGAYVANKLEQVIWKAYATRLNAISPALTPSVELLVSSNPSSVDGGLGLRSKSYLADFWNRLSHAERWKLIGGAMSTSSERHTTSGGKSSGKKDRTSSAASIASSFASGASLLTSSHSGSKPTHDGDDVMTLGSDGGLTPYNAKGPSSTLSVGAVSAGNTSFSMRQHRRGRKDAGRVSLPDTHGCGTVTTTSSHAADDCNDSIRDGDVGSAYGSAIQDSSDSNSWPWCTVRWDGISVVSEFFTSSLQRAGTDQDDWARRIGHKLLSKWADNNAMGLIIAEEERDTGKKKVQKAASSGVSTQPGGGSTLGTPADAKKKKPKTKNKRRNSLPEVTVSVPAPPVTVPTPPVVVPVAAPCVPAPVIAPPAPISAPDDDGSNWTVAKASKRTVKDKQPIILSRNKKPAPQPQMKPKVSPPKQSPPKPASPPKDTPPPVPVTSTVVAPLSPGVLWGDIEPEPIAIVKKAPQHSRHKSDETPKEAAVPQPPSPPKVNTPSPVVAPSQPIPVALPPPPVASQPSQDSMLLSTSVSAHLEACVHDMCMTFSLWCFDYALGRKPYETQVLDRLQNVLHSCLPGSSIQVFGSFATGLSVPGSDVDVVICGAFGDRSLACFQTLVQALQRESWVLSMHPITTAQIPVIKLTTPGPYPGAREIKMDLTFQSPLHRGHGTTGVSVAMCSVFPPLAPLVLALKQLLVEHDLNDPYSGGLSSYGVLLLVTCYLQNCCDMAALIPLFQQLPTHAMVSMGSAPGLCPYPLPIPPPVLGIVSIAHRKPTGTADAEAKQSFVSPPRLSPVAADAITTPVTGHGICSPSSSPNSKRGRSRSVDSPADEAVTTARAFTGVITLPSPLTRCDPHESRMFAFPEAKAVPAGVAKPTEEQLKAVVAIHEHHGMPVVSHFPLAPPVPTAVDIDDDPDFIPMPPPLGVSHIPPSPLLGAVLLGILKFYGSEFNSHAQAVSVRSGRWLPIDRRTAVYVDPVVIQDPVDESNNVGRNCFKFPHIQAAMLAAYNKLVTHAANGVMDPGTMLKTVYPSWYVSAYTQ